MYLSRYVILIPKSIILLKKVISKDKTYYSTFLLPHPTLQFVNLAKQKCERERGKREQRKEEERKKKMIEKKRKLVYDRQNMYTL